MYPHKLRTMIVFLQMYEVTCLYKYSHRFSFKLRLGKDLFDFTYLIENLVSKNVS